jgi:hypothetical protein
MSKNLKLSQSTRESLCANLGRLAGEHILRQYAGSRRPITIEKATSSEEDRFETHYLD